MVWQQKIYRRLLAPGSRQEDGRRRELILNVLLTGAIGLSVVTFISTLAGVILQSDYEGLSPLVMLAIIVLLAFMLFLSRRGLYRPITYVFIVLFTLLATWSTIRWGILLPQGILIHSLVIVMTGVLLSSRMAFYMVLVIVAILLGIAQLHAAGVIHYDVGWMRRTGGYPDVIVYGFTFGIIALVSWLSNREIKRSLARAHASEKELLKERRMLEVKVKERTQALEKSQVEKMMDLQRFAEFGRLSSTLLHELANPLMAVSMNLEQLEGKNRSKLLAHAREGIAHMEQYVEAARRQLRNQSEVRFFDVADEVRRVAGFLEPKAAAQRVELRVEPLEGVKLKGDSIRFNHIISNLLSNAIDAYEGTSADAPRTVTVTMEQLRQVMQISVIDHGQGISKDQLPHLFEPFYTTKQMTRGTGLGLAIVKQAVEEAFGGTIKATHSKSNGTQFVVRLPLP